MKLWQKARDIDCKSMGLSVSKERVDGKQNILDWKQTILIVKHEIN